MRYFLSDANLPIRYRTSGNLISKDGFLHQRRILDTHVFIMVREGTLKICQDGNFFEIGPKQFILLKAGEEHYGYAPSSGRLSYYWVHFTFDTPLAVLTTVQMIRLFESEETAINNSYLLPEQGEISHTQKILVLFNQLLDLSRQETSYQSRMIDYALSLLILEISQELIELRTQKLPSIPPTILQVMEWVKSNYYANITLTDIAKEIGYNADYLSSLFKQSTGISFVSYINQIRIDHSKSLLINYNITIKEVAYSCGFTDEKYYMKQFKKREGMTPSQYKKAFTKKKINQR